MYYILLKMTLFPFYSPLYREREFINSYCAHLYNFITIQLRLFSVICYSGLVYIAKSKYERENLNPLRMR
jgi:hypothetical protein